MHLLENNYYYFLNVFWIFWRYIIAFSQPAQCNAFNHPGCVCVGNPLAHVISGRELTTLNNLVRILSTCTLSVYFITKTLQWMTSWALAASHLYCVSSRLVSSSELLHVHRRGPARTGDQSEETTPPAGDPGDLQHLPQPALRVPVSIHTVSWPSASTVPVCLSLSLFEVWSSFWLYYYFIFVYCRFLDSSIIFFLLLFPPLF